MSYEKNTLDFFVDIKDLIDININLLEQDLKKAHLDKPVLIAENDAKSLILFFENDENTSFYTWSEPVGLSKKFNARSLDSAVSRASCLGMFSSPTGFISCKDQPCGVIDIDKEKLGIDWKVDEYPKRKPSKMKESKSLIDYKKEINQICETSCNIMGNEDALFFTQIDSDTFLLKGITLDELNDADFSPQEMWDAISRGKPIAKDFKAKSFKDYTLTIKLNKD